MSEEKKIESLADDALEAVSGGMSDQLRAAYDVNRGVYGSGSACTSRLWAAGLNPNTVLKLADALLDSSRFYLEFIDYASSNFESTHHCLMYLAETFKQYGDKELSDKILDSLDMLIRVATGDLRPEADVTADTVTVAE